MPLLLALACAAPSLDAHGLGQAPSAKSADTWTVCFFTGDFNRLEDALAVAASGDTIQVCPGTYTANLDLGDRALVLVGTSGSRFTVLQPAGPGPVVRMDGATAPGGVRIEGFTIRNGRGSVGEGGNLDCRDSELTLVDVVIRGGRAAEGGGLRASGCAIDVQSSTFYANEATDRGGGAFVENGSGRFVDARFLQNEAGDQGGGLRTQGNAGLRVLGGSFTGNAATLGGAASIADDTLVQGVQVADNTSTDRGGGLYLDYAAGCTIRGSVFTGNYGAGDGGALNGRTSTCTIAGNVFEDNASGDDGGAFRLDHGENLVESNQFLFNVAGDDGGAVKGGHGVQTYRNNYFYGNEAGDQGGGLEVDNEGSSIYDNVFDGNRAAWGAALHFKDNLTPDEEVLGNLFLGNEATRCGGAIEADVNNFPIRIAENTFSGNTAGDGGGLCAWDTELLVENNVFEGNTTEGDGGAIHLSRAAGTLVNLTLWNNDAGRGALYTKNSPRLDVRNLLVVENTGNKGIYASGALPAFAYNDVWGNASADWGGDVGDLTGTDGNLSVDPDLVDPAGGDFHLAPGSPCIDAGDPAILDPDGSRSDIGATGGPGGAWM